MNLLRFGLVGIAAGLLGLGIGCKPRPKVLTELQRKEAAHLVSEAEFAGQIREWARAEGLLAKAVQVNPNEGAYWTSLGTIRVRLGNKAGAKEAYHGALKAFQVEAGTPSGRKEVEPWLQQVQVLALLGRTADARSLLEQTAKKFPADRELRRFIEGKVFDQLLADPNFKQGML